ncbi:rRNA methyltransferase 2, mitochondrial, partial [Orchesella cincta]
NVRLWGNCRNIHLSCCVFKVVPSNLKGKSKSSQEWMARQLNDPYVKKAHDMNYRARSAFKLIEIDDKVKILKPGQTVVECGAAPGAWSQVIVQRINSNGKAVVKKRKIGTVIGIDLLPIAPLEGAIFLDGCDFTSVESVEKIKAILAARSMDKVEGDQPYIKEGLQETAEREVVEGENNNVNVKKDEVKSKSGEMNGMVDVVLSDMAPNATGQRDTDHPRIMRLVEAALVFAVKNGKPGGHFLAKVWDGSEVKRLESVMEKYYEKVSRHKPQSSRNDSSEIFILGRFKK